MNARYTRLGLVVLAAITFACAHNDHHDNVSMEKRAAAHGLISPDQAIEKAVAAKAGKVTAVDLDHEWLGYVYEIEVVDGSGIEWDIDIDAKSGQVRKMKQDH